MCSSKYLYKLEFWLTLIMDMVWEQVSTVLPEHVGTTILLMQIRTESFQQQSWYEGEHSSPKNLNNLV